MSTDADAFVGSPAHGPSAEPEPAVGHRPFATRHAASDRLAGKLSFNTPLVYLGELVVYWWVRTAERLGQELREKGAFRVVAGSLALALVWSVFAFLFAAVGTALAWICWLIAGS